MTFMTFRAIGFDLFGTLLQAEGNSSVCLQSLHQKLCEHGVDIPFERFSEIYRKVHEEHRPLRLNENREFTNQLELSKVLGQLGYRYEAESQLVEDAVRAYFSGWTVTAFEGVQEMLQDLARKYKIGVITNFTDSAFIYRTLRDLHLLSLFNQVIISADVGWRKPSPKIFNEFLRLAASSPHDTLFIGDDVNCDIVGANAVGMGTILFAAQSGEKAANCSAQPSYVASSIKEVKTIINQLT